VGEGQYRDPQYPVTGERRSILVRLRQGQQGLRANLRSLDRWQDRGNDPGRKWLDQKWHWDKLQSRIGADASKKVWDDISTRFAHGASGEVNAFIKDMRDEPDFPKKTYMDLERPILTDPMNTKVTKLHEHE